MLLITTSFKLLENNVISIEDYIITPKKISILGFENFFEGYHSKTKQNFIIQIVQYDEMQYYHIQATINAQPICFPFLLNLQKAYLNEIEKVFYLVFDNYNGSLNEYLYTSPSYNINHKNMQEYEALRIFFQVVEGALWLWNANLVHGNIQPDCVFFQSRNQNIKIFMLSSLGSSFLNLSSNKNNLKKLNYTAPEILKNEETNYLIDIWSLGLLLHEMLFGYKYYDGESNDEIINKILHTKYKLTSQQKKTISCQTLKLLKGMINHDRSKRFEKKTLENKVIEFKEYDFVRNIIGSYEHHSKFDTLSFQSQNSTVWIQYAKMLHESAWSLSQKGYETLSTAMQKEALEIYNFILGENAEETKFALIRYAQNLIFTGSLEEAKINGLKALQLYQNNTSGNQSAVARAYCIVGNIYHLAGEAKLSQQFYKKDLNISFEIHGEYHRDTATACGNMGNSFHACENYVGAIEFFKKAKKLLIQLHGLNHLDVAFVYHNLALTNLQLKNIRLLQNTVKNQQPQKISFTEKITQKQKNLNEQKYQYLRPSKKKNRPSRL